MAPASPRRALLSALLAILCVTPLGVAHEPRGTPKNYCEPLVEWDTHEYGLPAQGVLLQGHEDGNVLGDCDGSGIDPFVLCVSMDPDDPVETLYVGGCPGDLPIADLDGHSEYARGGAWILVESGDGRSGGTVYCFGEEGHHAAYGPSFVDDLAMGAGASYLVAADMEDVSGAAQRCGDNLDDQGAECIGRCTVTFPPGLDGAYHVYVTGTQGHVVW